MAFRQQLSTAQETFTEVQYIGSEHTNSPKKLTEAVVCRHCNGRTKSDNANNKALSGADLAPNFWRTPKEKRPLM